MGYRLEVSELKHKQTYGKLYGYCENEKELKSYKWLEKKGFLKDVGDNWYDYYENPQIILSPNEFKEFITLYNEDCNNFENNYIKHPKDWIIKNEQTQELINGIKDIVLEWY